MKKAILAIICLTLILSTGCKKNEEEEISPEDTPQIFGSWRNEYTLNGLQGRETLTFQSDFNFTDYFEGWFQNKWNFFPDNHSSKGTFILENNRLTLTIVYMNYDGANWLTPISPPQVEIVIFQIGDGGNSLTIQCDLNHDGDYLDERETVSFTRIS